MRKLYSMSIAAFAALSMVLVGTAVAQKAGKYTRESTIKKVDVKQTNKTKKLKPKKKKEETVPVVTADEFIERQGDVKHIRKEQIALLEELIEDTDDDDNEKADLQFRLAELHSQLSRYWRFRGMEMYAKIDKAKKSKKKGLKKKQKSYFKESKKAMNNAIDVFKSIFKAGYKNYPRMDEVLFYFAYTLQQTKDPEHIKTSRTVFHRLIKDYPDSKYIPEAYLAFADYYFEQNSLANAEQFYDKVLKFKKSKVYTYALYKKGWVFLNLDQPQDALEIFFQVSQRTKGDKQKATLNKASKKDFVRAYAEVGKAELAYKAFQRVDKNFAFDMLQILGGIYLEQGKAKKAIFTYREMIGLKKKHKMVCEWQYNVVHAMLSVGDHTQKVDEIENLVDLYASLKGKDILPEDQMDECAETAESVNSEMAKIWHNEAMKTLNVDTLQYVDRLYNMYLRTFTESPEYGEMQYYYAELLWSRAENEKNARLATEKWENAAIAFTDVVKSGKLKGKLLKESAYAAVLGWKNALAVDPRTKAPPEDEVKDEDAIPEPKEIAPKQQKMIEAFDVYIDYIKDPKDEELVMMKFLKARIYWQHNHFDEAIPLFEDIVEKHLSHETSEYSINLLLDTLNRTKKYSKMIKLVDQLLNPDNKAFVKYLEDREDLAARLETLKRQSLRKAAEQLETDAKESGDYAKYVACGQAYIDIFNRDPNGEGGDEVLYNAGVCFEEGKSIGAAITMFELLGQRFPKSNHTQKALARLGNNYARIAWYNEAADKLEDYAKKYAGEKDAYKAMSDAVFYRKGIGQDKKALDDTDYFIRKFKKKHKKEAAEAKWSMTSIYEKKNDQDKVVSHLYEYLKGHRAAGGIDREIIAYVKIGMIQWEESCPGKGINGACIKMKRERSIVQRRRAKRRGNNLPTQCGPESKIKLTVITRDARKVKSATTSFKKAIALFGGGKAVAKVPDKDLFRTALMVKYVAAAQFFLAESTYESFLKLAFPAKLDFDPRKPKVAERSKKRFMEWFKKKTEAGAKAKGLYMGIIAMGDAHYAIASAARVGQITQNFSDALFTASIPNDVRTGKWAEDKVDAYCDELMTQAQPLEDQSVEAFDFCLGKSTELNWFNQWSKLCEKELGQIRPQDFPTATELRAMPENVAPIIDTEDPILKLEE